jgi:hypothetical protein
MGCRAAQKELINDAADHVNFFGPAFDRFVPPGQSVFKLA